MSMNVKDCILISSEKCTHNCAVLRCEFNEKRQKMTDTELYALNLKKRPILCSTTNGSQLPEFLS